MRIIDLEKYLKTRTHTQLMKIKSSLKTLDKEIPFMFDEIDGLDVLLDIVNFELKNKKSKK